MKSLKYAFFILFLCCFLTAAMAAAEVYTLEAKFIGVNEGSVPELTIELLEDAREVDIEIAENCRFFATTWSSGQRTAQITFDEFAKRFAGHMIQFDFVEHKNDYLVVECRNVLIQAD